MSTIPRIQVSIDGGQTYHEVDDVHVIYQYVDLPGGEGEDSELYMTIDPDGIHAGVAGETEDENLGTHVTTIDQIVAACLSKP
jgi:hypothetical protein